MNIQHPELDSFTTVAGMMPGALSADADITDDPASWGALVSQSKNGRSSTYHRANADGSVTITHVFWTVEAAEGCQHCDHRRDYVLR